MLYSVSDTVTAIGKVIVKPERSFSFLAYLIQGDQNVLIDTVPERAATTFLEELASCVPLDRLDALILNHSEEDHSGALGALLAQHPSLPIYCSPACRQRLCAAYPNANFHTVETGSTVDIGSLRFYFVHTPGLHWDDNMTTYLAQERILFSNDLFGQKLGAEIPVDTQFPRETLLEGAKNYYESVFAPATTAEKSVIFELLTLGATCVAPGHGVILQTYLNEVFHYYKTVCVE